MPRSSFGHVRQRTNGRWQARYQTPDGRQHSFTTSTKTAAAKWLRDEASKLDAGTWQDRRVGAVTFEAAAADWRQYGTVGLRPSTFARDVGYLDWYLLPAFADVRVDRIDGRAVERWAAQMAQAGRAPATVRKAAQILDKVIRRQLGRSPVDQATLPTVERTEMRFLTPVEVARLADAIDGRYRGIVMVGATGGLRIGEMAGLRVGSVIGGIVTVGGSVTEVDGKLTFGPPKTRAGRRAIALPASVAALVAELTAGKTPDRFVFEAPLGGPIRFASWRSRFWVPAIAAAGLDGLRVHDLRHTAVALWIAAGAGPLEIARRAGHSSVAVVLDLYGHLLPGTDEGLADRLDGLL